MIGEYENHIIRIKPIFLGYMLKYSVNQVSGDNSQSKVENSDAW